MDSHIDQDAALAHWERLGGQKPVFAFNGELVLVVSRPWQFSANEPFPTTTRPVGVKVVPAFPDFTWIVLGAIAANWPIEGWSDKDRLRFAGALLKEPGKDLRLAGMAIAANQPPNITGRRRGDTIQWSGPVSW